MAQIRKPRHEGFACPIKYGDLFPVHQNHPNGSLLLPNDIESPTTQSKAHHLGGLAFITSFLVRMGKVGSGTELSIKGPDRVFKIHETTTPDAWVLLQKQFNALTLRCL